MRISALVAVSSLLALTTATSSGRADYFYNWGPSLPIVYSDNSGMHITLSDGDQTGPVSGQQHMIATVLSTYVNPGVRGTDNFSQGQTVALALDLTDGTQAGHITFSISISGSLTAGSPDLTNLSYTFLDGISRALTLNGTVYGISLDGPGTIPGSIMATITPGGPVADPSDAPDGTTNNMPEPTTLVLGTQGLVGATLTAWRRLKKGHATT